MRNLFLLLCFLMGWFSCSFGQQTTIQFDKTAQRYGVVQHRKDTIVPFTFQKIRFVPPKFYQVSTVDQKKRIVYGMYDTLGNQVLTPVYLNIYPDPTADFFHLYLADSTGIYDFNENKKKMFSGQPYIYPLFSPSKQKVYYCVQSDDDFTLFDETWNQQFSFPGRLISLHETNSNTTQFIVKNNRSELLGLLDEKGNLLIPCAYSSLEQPANFYATFGKGNEWLGSNDQGYDFFSPPLSQPILHADFIGCFNHRLIVQQGKKWQILDEELNQMYETSEGALNFQSTPFDPKTFDLRKMYSEMGTFPSANFIQTLPSKESYVFEIQYGTPTKNCSSYATDCFKQEPLFGLIQYASQQKIPVRYRYLFPILVDSSDKTESKRYFWGLLKEKDAWKLDIYSNELKLLHQYELADTSYWLIQQSLHFQQRPKGMLLQNKQQQFGLIGASGESLIPFDGNACYPLYDYPTQRIQFYVHGNRGNYRLFDKNGRLCSETIFDTLYVPVSNYNLFILGKNSDGYSLFNAEGTCLIEKGTQYFYEHQADAIGERFRYYTPTAYIVKDDYLYLLRNNKLMVVNDQYAAFSANTLRLSFGWVVDRNGKIVSKEWKR